MDAYSFDNKRNHEQNTTMAYHSYSRQVTAKVAFPSIENATDPTTGNLFVQKVRTVILAHLDDSSFSVEDLSKKLYLSYNQLYRRLKSQTNETPISFIKKVRLTRASELLLEGRLNISEVAYATGFSDPNYFSRAFHQLYGKSPSAFRIFPRKEE